MNWSFCYQLPNVGNSLKISNQDNGRLYRRGADLVDKTHRVEPVFGAESLRDEAKPAPRPRASGVGPGDTDNYKWLDSFFWAKEICFVSYFSQSRNLMAKSTCHFFFLGSVR